MTKTLGILGYPITHTLSPIMHNAAFCELGIDAQYVPFEVRPENIESALAGLIALGVSGVNVTIPHKESVLPFLDEIDIDARRIGAVNTILLKDGQLVGYNTDAQGFGNAFAQEIARPLAGQQVMLCGAGGAARAVFIQLLKENVKDIIILSRTLARAAKMLDDLLVEHRDVKTTLCSFKDFSENNFSPDVLINATSVGLQSNDPHLVPVDFFSSNMIVCDLIYNPPRTPLLRMAEEAGSLVMNGLGMLAHQGALAFNLWTGVQAPIDVMQRALLNAFESTRP